MREKSAAQATVIAQFESSHDSPKPESLANFEHFAASFRSISFALGAAVAGECEHSER